MSVKDKMLAKLMKAFKAKDAAEVEKLAEEMKDDIGEMGEEVTGNGDTHIHIHAGESNGQPETLDEDPELKTEDEDGNEARFAALEAGHEELKAGHAAILAKLDELMGMEQQEGSDTEGSLDDGEEMTQALKDEAPEGLEEEASKAKDSAYLGDSFRDTAALAEILVPGIKIPTFDRAAAPGQSMKRICGLRRQALDAAYAKADTRMMISEVLAGRTLDTKNMTCDAVRTIFRAAGAMQRAANNRKSTGSGVHDSGQGTKKKAVTSIAELNKINAAKQWNA